MHVFVVGFMGVGKSTVGRCLAAALEMNFVDLDDEIEARSGESVAAIFASTGEAAFRKLEHAVLEELVDQSPAVIATGGGVMGESANRKIFKSHGVSVWLDLPFEDIAHRMQGEELGKRPLYQDEANARALFEKRLPDYRKCDLRVAIGSDDSPTEVASRIEQLLRERK